jgi:hypothetical protein
MQRKTCAALAGLIVGTGATILAANPAMAAAPPSCVGVRVGGGIPNHVTVDNACATTQRVKIDWGTWASDSACQTIAAKTSRVVRSGNILAEYSGISTC